jgi:hypothetical protein
MGTTINGHKLSDRQVEVLDTILDYVRKNSGDSQMGPHTGPKGDGRWIAITEIFPARDNQDNGSRRVAGRLATRGVLRSCELVYERGGLRAVPLHDQPILSLEPTR